jgi:hypothetical protein
MLDRRLPALVIALWIAGACGSNTTPVTATPPPAPTPTLIPGYPLTVTGNTALTTVGETSQLTATAVFSPDGARIEVTNDTRWVSSDPSIATISAAGVLNAVHFGATSIQATYRDTTARTASGGALVTITPTGTFIARGETREPGHGPLPNVQVAETLSRQSTITDANGLFSFGSLSVAHLRFVKEGYEPVEMDLAPNGSPSVYTNLPMQRIVRLMVGQSISRETLYNNDTAYTMPGGQQCQPCRLIHVDVPSRGTLHLQLTWLPPGLDFELWVNGQRFGKLGNTPEMDADIVVSAGELIMYVGSTSAGRGGAFTLASTLTP